MFCDVFYSKPYATAARLRLTKITPPTTRHEARTFCHVRVSTPAQMLIMAATMG